jgi:hypothetical protein
VASGSEIGLVNRMSIVQIGLVNKVESGSEIGLVNRVSIVQIGLVKKVYMHWFIDRPR